MKVLITGGAGFIGSSVSDFLLKEGHLVLVIDNYQTGNPENNSQHTNLSIVEGSISDAQLVKTTFNKFLPDVVLHAAASYKDPTNWEEDVTTNIIGSLNIIRSAEQSKVKKIIYLQTSLCYGLHPIENPIKTTAEQYLELSKLEFISFRLANVYGPRNLSGPLPTFFHRLSQGLNCTIVNTRRDFIFIDDVVSVITKAISGKGTNKYYHISSGSEHSIKELFNYTQKHIGFQSKSIIKEKEMGADDVASILLDSTQTKNDFEWNTQTEFEEGVKKTINWYKQHRLTKTYTHLNNIY